MMSATRASVSIPSLHTVQDPPARTQLHDYVDVLIILKDSLHAERHGVNL